MRIWFLILTAIYLSGCSFGGFGGDGEGGGSAAQDPTTPTLVEGYAIKGPISGTVVIYGINSDGTKGQELARVKTENDGHFTSSVMYYGPLFLEAFGTYIDEATGNELLISEKEPLRAVMPTPPQKNIKVIITPLTELAVRKMLKEVLLTTENIIYANSLVSNMFKVNITDSLKPTDAADPGATQPQKDYALVLATISQMAADDADARGLSGVLNDLSNDVANGEMTKERSDYFKSELMKYVGLHNVGITSIDETNMVNVGGKVQPIKLATTGDLAGSPIAGINVSLTLPQGVTVRTDFLLKYIENGVLLGYGPLANFVSTSGVLPPATSTTDVQLVAYLSPSASSQTTITVGITSVTGFGIGEFATINCDIPPGGNLTSAQVISYKVVDNELGAEIPGAAVVVEQ